MSGADGLRFREAVALLRERVPALLPVRVRRRRLGKEHRAVCAISAHRSWFNISIDSGHPEAFATQLLTHEWAHAVAWHEGDFVRTHGPEWALAYARCYKVIYEPEEGHHA